MVEFRIFILVCKLFEFVTRREGVLWCLDSLNQLTRRIKTSSFVVVGAIDEL